MEKKYKIKLDSTLTHATITPNDFHYDEMPGVDDIIDLNNDGLRDLIIFFGACGNEGHCMFGVFVQCDSGNFSCVYKPDYWLSAGGYKVVENPKNQTIDKENLYWRDIILYDRNDIGHPERKPGVYIDATLKFDGNTYVRKR